MTIEQIKEELSNSFVGLVASYLGYKLTKPSDTGGVDYSLTKDTSYISKGKLDLFNQDSILIYN